MAEGPIPQSLSPELLALLVCPVTHQSLRIAPPEILARLTSPAEAALIREDGRVAYPVRKGIPVLVPGAAITLEQPTAE